MLRKIKFLIPIGLLLLSSCLNKQQSHEKQPNIIIFYADDLGYADLGCYGAKGVKTPNIDRLAAGGIRFTDAHCSAATCTPSRFSLLTGSYAFRQKARILPGDAPLLISPDMETMPGVLQKAGYETGIIGKWHLGLGDGQINWNDSIYPGPNEVGFDYSYIIPATGDRVPCVFVENHHVIGLEPNDPIKVDYDKKILGVPTGLDNPEMLKVLADKQHSQSIVNGISRIGYMRGGEKALWVDEDFADVLTGKAAEFIGKNRENPFFLLFAFHDIHVPRAPHQRFVGKSSMGSRGDAIFQMDWCVGQITNLLQEYELSGNTLLIFTSDNGPVLDDGYFDGADKLVGDHNPSGIYRGGKYSAFEAGTRVPTIVYWLGRVRPGISDALLSQVDLFASLAGLAGQSIPQGSAPDSYNRLSDWLGETSEGCVFLIEEAFTLAIREGDWKYIHPVEEDPPDWFNAKKIESGLSQDIQLYNLVMDPGEKHNLAEKYPGKARELKDLLIRIMRNQ